MESYSKTVAEKLIGRETLIWSEHGNTRYLTGDSIVLTKPTKSIYMVLGETTFEKVQLLNHFGHVVDTIYKWMIPVLQQVYNVPLQKGSNIVRIPFDMAMGDNAIPAGYVVKAFALDPFLRSLPTSYTFKMEYTSPPPVAEMAYTFYATNLYTGDAKGQTSNGVVVVPLNFTHHLYCIYFEIERSHIQSVSLTVATVGEERLCLFTTAVSDGLVRAGSFTILPLYRDADLQSYDHVNAPFNASQAERMQLEIKLKDVSHLGPIKPFKVAAIAYQYQQPRVTAHPLMPTVGSENVALGYAAMGITTTGSNKVAIGYSALNNVTSDGSTLIGHR